MKTFLLQIIGLFIVIVVGLMVSTNGSPQNSLLNIIPFGTNRNSVNQLVITDPSGQNTKARINIEIAKSKEAKAQGLGNRDFLDSNSGMLFVYDKADRYRFWMKGMRFSLDFIWIKDEAVVDLLPNIPPPDTSITSDASLPVYTSVTEADKILEVNAGFIQAQNIQVGDKISY